MVLYQEPAATPQADKPDTPTRKTAAELSGDELLYAAQRMASHGGSFAACIAEAFYVADTSNRARLVKAFDYLFERYFNDF